MRKFLFCLIALITASGYAQNPGDVVQNFGNGSGFQSSIAALEVQSDGKIICGGYFKNFNQHASNYIIRLNADGTKDASFSIGTGFDGFVNVIKCQPDGKIIIGGTFTSYNGASANRIVRLNSDGSKDTSFAVGSGFNSSTTSLCLQSDGKIIVGGTFSDYNGFPAIKLIRLNTDGTRDTGFLTTSGFSYGTDVVNSISVQSDGKVVVGGKFSSYGATSANNIIRLNSDASADATFVTGSGFSDYVKSLVIQPDGKILVGGNFTNYNGNVIVRIARLNSDGSNDSTFTSGSGFDNYVSSIALQSDGKILIGGSFTEYNLSPQSGIIRLNANGTKDSSFNIGNVQLIGGVVYNVNSIKIESSGKILVGGPSTIINNKVITGLMRINTDGTYDNSIYLGNGFNNTVSEINVQNDGKILVGGDFTSYNGNFISKLARINSDGTLDATFNTGTSFDNIVRAITLQTDGKILVGGSFISYNGTTVNRILRLNTDGTIDAAFSIGTGFNGTVRAISLQTDGKILVGGSFTSYNGTSKTGLIRLNTDGSVDNTFSSSSFSNTTKIRLQSDGKIIIVYAPSSVSIIARLNTDGSTDAAFSTGSGFNSYVYDLEIQQDGKIIAVGGFNTFDGISRAGIARLNSNGSLDTSFTVGAGFNNNANVVEIQQDGKILVGGVFTNYDNYASPWNKIIRLNTNGTIDASFSIGSGFDNNKIVYAMKIQQDEKILVGGSFTSYNGSYASSNLIKLGSTTLSNEDFEINKSVNLWPNPVVDVLNISSIDSTEILSVKVYDLQGKLVLQSNEESINTNNLTTGLYLVKILTDRGSVTKKIIKK